MTGHRHEVVTVPGRVRGGEQDARPGARPAGRLPAAAVRDPAADLRPRVAPLDVALAVLSTALLLGEAVAEDTGSVGPLVAAGAMGSSLAFRRRFPLGSYLVSSAALEVIAWRYYDAGLYPYPNVIALYSVGLYAASRARAVAGLIVGLAGIVFYWTLVPAVPIPWLPGILVAIWALAWVGGQAERQRRRAAADVVRRAQEAEERRGAERAAAVDRERTRIAHEVHDIVGHALTVMVLQAGAARRVLTRDPEAGAAALAPVESVGRSALDDLDRALTVLDGSAARRPARGTADLAELAAQFTAAGVPVHLRVEGRPRALTTPVDLAAYRVVQEALTNVAKHAPGTPAEVEVRYDDDVLRLRVTDRGTAAGPVDPSGRGLAGIRDRASALGGSAEAGPDPQGGWSVRCELPVGR